MPERNIPSIPQTKAPELFKGFDKEFKAQQARVTTAQGVVASLSADIGARGGRLLSAESKQSFIQQGGGIAAAPAGAAAGVVTGALLGGAPGAAAGGVLGAAAPGVISTYMKLASLTNQDLFYDKTLIENTTKLRDSLYKMTGLMESEEWRLSVMAYMSRAGLEDLSITGLAGKTNSKGETNPYKPTPEDVDWWNRMVRPRIEESRMRSPSLIRDVEADLASKAKINIVNMDDLTTAEIAEAWRTPATVDISKYGLSNSELRALYTEFGLTEEQQTEAFQEFDDLAQQFIDQWIERSQTLEAFRASVASPEIDVTIGERLMQAIVRPALGGAEFLDEFWYRHTRAAMGIGIVMQAKTLEAVGIDWLENWEKDIMSHYQENFAQSGSAWDAMGMSVDDWGMNGWIKLGIETFYDPTAWWGYGLIGRASRLVPFVGSRIGPRISAFERTFLDRSDIPFTKMRNWYRYGIQVPEFVPKFGGRFIESPLTQTQIGNRLRINYIQQARLTIIQHTKQTVIANHTPELVRESIRASYRQFRMSIRNTHDQSYLAQLGELIHVAVRKVPSAEEVRVIAQRLGVTIPEGTAGRRRG